MGFLHGGSNASNPPTYTGLQVQTSAEGMVLPVIYGRNRVSPNLIWCDNFQAKKSGKKGGGKGGGKSGNKDYQAGVILAMCEGPISFGLIFIDSTTVGTFAYLNLLAVPGTTTQTPFDCISTLPGFVPMAYRNVAYAATNSYDLGSAATLPQHNFEIYGFFDSTAAASGLPDANPADFIVDLCTNERYGLQMPAGLIGDTTQYRAYCTAQNLLMSPVLDKQEQFISTLQRWAQLSNTWIFWSENKMKFVPLGVNAISAYGATYTPYTTVQYNLGFDDFIAKKGSPPLSVLRADISKAYNWVKLNARSRPNLYATATLEWKDPASIQKYGTFQAQEVQADEVCDRGIAQVMATLIGQRALYLRNDFKFTLGWNYCLLEPGDIVSLSDATLGLSLYPVRIKEINEDKDGNLAVTAEDCPTGYGGGIAVTPQASASPTLPALDVDPGNVNAPPLIYEPAASVTAGQPQIWIGASGGPYWGGATVYASTDNVTYAPIGTLNAPIPQGVLLSSLASHADPDLSDTLAVDLTESLTALGASVTHADADAGRTLCMVGSKITGWSNPELIGYGNVAANSTNSYSSNLTYLRRGFYGSTIASHAASQPFAVIVPANMLELTLPQAYVGVTLYLKLVSFNLYGQGAQDISTVTAYQYIPAGPVYTIAAPASAALAITTPTGATSISLTLSWTASAGPSLGAYEAQMSSDGGSTWVAADVTLGASATSFTLASATPSASYQGRVRAISANGLAVSGWSTSAVVNAGSGPSIGGSGSLALVNGDTPVGIVTNSSGVPIYVAQ